MRHRESRLRTGTDFPATCCLIGKENMGNEPKQQADDAHVEHQGIEKQELNNAVAGSRTAAKAQMRQGQQHA